MPKPKAWLTTKERWDGIPRALWLMPVSAYAKNLYGYLTARADQQLIAMPSQEELQAAISAGSDNTVRRAMTQLIEHGMVELEQHGGRHGGPGAPRAAGGTYLPNVYRVKPPRDWKLQGSEPAAEGAHGSHSEPTAANAEGEKAPPTAPPAAPRAKVPTAPGADIRETEREKNQDARAPAKQDADRAAPEDEDPESVPPPAIPTAEVSGPRPPDLPRYAWGGKKLALLWLEMWKLAAKSGGAVRIELGSGLMVDVYAAHGGSAPDGREARPRSVVLWREGSIDTTRKDVSEVMKKWNKEVDTFMQHVFKQNGEDVDRGWHRTAAAGYPIVHVKYTARASNRVTAAPAL